MFNCVRLMQCYSFCLMLLCNLKEEAGEVVGYVHRAPEFYLALKVLHRPFSYPSLPFLLMCHGKLCDQFLGCYRML